MRLTRVYAAHPVTSYGTEHEARSLAALRALLPDCEIYDPAGRYRREHGWRRAWPGVLASLSGLVVFGAKDGTIGTGCLRELTDALAWGLPVAGLDGDVLKVIGGVQLLPVPWRTARHVGRLVLGDPVEPRDFLVLEPNDRTAP